jgi:phytoene synthase
MRLQWWREALDAAYRGDAAGHPAARALRDLIQTHEPSRGLFDRLVDAREADLEELPPEDLPALEAYADGTAATLVALVMEILGLHDDLSFAVGRHVGIAWGLTGLLRAVPFHASIGRLMLPPRLLRDHGVRPADVLAGRASPGLVGVGRRIAGLAHEHLATARTHTARIPRAALPGLLIAPLAERYLALLEAAGGDLMDTRWSRPRPHPALLAWKLWRGRF